MKEVKKPVPLVGCNLFYQHIRGRKSGSENVIKSWTGDIDYYYEKGKIIGSQKHTQGAEWMCEECNSNWE